MVINPFEIAQPIKPPRAAFRLLGLAGADLRSVSPGSDRNRSVPDVQLVSTEQAQAGHLALAGIPFQEYGEMVWVVEYTDQFGAWYESLATPAQDAVDRSVGLLEAKGSALPFPHSSGVSRSRHTHMRELRVQSGGEPLRIFYAFDPRRVAILLIGGNKAGDDRFYHSMIPLADRLYDEYLDEIRKEGLIP